MWIDKNGNVYGGECAVGDREATPQEIAAWDARGADQLAAPEPLEKLRSFLAANPDVAALLA